MKYFSEEQLRLVPEVLQETNVKVIDKFACKDWYEEAFGKFSKIVIPVGTLCAGYKDGRTDACLVNS